MNGKGIKRVEYTKYLGFYGLLHEVVTAHNSYH